MTYNILELPGSRTIFYGTFIHTPELGKLEILPTCSIGVDIDGRIKFIERNTTAQQCISKYGEYWAHAKIVETLKPTSFFFPGFFDTHIHAPQFPNNGIFGNTTLLDWLSTYTFPLEASLSDTEIAKHIYHTCVERTLSHGTTTASYFATIHVEATKILADLALKLGQRALIGRVCMDQNTPDYYRHKSVEEAHEADLAVINYINEIDAENEFIAPILTPRFAPSCSMEVMKMQGKLAKDYNIRVQTHISENSREIEWVGELFPECEGYADVYRQAGLLTKKTILAHAIYLTQKEKDMVKEHQCGVSHCPISNSSITSGECPVKDLLRQNIKVGLGTDVSGGFAPSILVSARQALLVSRHIAMKSGKEEDKLTIEEVLWLATLGGAQTCDVADRGTFEIGSQFDAQMIELETKGSQVDVFDWQQPLNGNSNILHSNLDPKFDPTRSDNYNFGRMNDLVAKWLFNGDDRNTTAVWVAGRCVVDKSL